VFIAGCSRMRLGRRSGLTRRQLLPARILVLACMGAAIVGVSFFSSVVDVRERRKVDVSPVESGSWFGGRKLLAEGDCCTLPRGCDSGQRCPKLFEVADSTLICKKQGTCTKESNLGNLPKDDSTKNTMVSNYNAANRFTQQGMCCSNSDQCTDSEFCESLCCSLKDNTGDCDRDIVFNVGNKVACCKEASKCSGDDDKIGRCQPWSADTFHSCGKDAGGAYPKDVFTCTEKKNGAAALHFLGMLYMFIALAIVCDDYFVAALEVLVKRLDIKDDVAGATFMAAGGSAPELFTSVIGVFIAENDVGFGTIVGSAVFNILLVIGACSVAAKTLLALTWWPLARDSLCYSIAIMTLYLVVINENSEISLTDLDQQALVGGQLTSSNKHKSVIVWWEAVVLLCLYAGYVMLMKYNERLEKWVKSKMKKSKVAPAKSQASSVSLTSSKEKEASKDIAKVAPASGDGTSADSPEGIARSPTPTKSGASLAPIDRSTTPNGSNKVAPEEGSESPALQTVGSMKGAALKMQMRLSKGGLSPGKKLALAASLVIQHNREKKAHGRVQLRRLAHEQEVEDKKKEHRENQDQSKSQASLAMPMESTVKDPEKEEGEDENEDPLKFPGKDAGILAIIWWFVGWPIQFSLAYTLPDCKVEAKEKWYPATFIGSILWIGFYSYWMVWWASEFGLTIGLPIPVMGLTILAAGTSVPDLLTSVIVAKRGLGDMAVSSSIGSNIFDLCMGLPLPWFLKTVVLDLAQTGSTGYVRIGSESMEFSLIMLFALLGVTIGSILMFKWQISKPMGYLMFVLYGIFVTLSLLVEYDVMVVDIQGTRPDGKC